MVELNRARKQAYLARRVEYLDGPSLPIVPVPDPQTRAYRDWQQVTFAAAKALQAAHRALWAWLSGEFADAGVQSVRVVVHDPESWQWKPGRVQVVVYADDPDGSAPSERFRRAERALEVIRRTGALVVLAEGAAPEHDEQVAGWWFQCVEPALAGVEADE